MSAIRKLTVCLAMGGSRDGDRGGRQVAAELAADYPET